MPRVPTLTRRQWIVGVAGATAGVGLAASVGTVVRRAFTVELEYVAVTRHAVAGVMQPGVPTLRVLQLSDLHLSTIGAREERVAAAVAAHRPDLVVLAGFMRLVGPTFLEAFGGRCVNTHPALSPAFPGMHAPADALAYGVTVTGATLFVVDAGVDTGPIVAQTAVPVEEDDDVASLHERIKVAERRMLVDAVGRMARNGFTLDGRKVRIGR